MKRYNVTDGIVIRRRPLPSGDLVVTLLSDGGKWRAVARKGKLPGGNLGKLSLFHDVTVQYYRKRDDDLALLTQVALNGALPRLTDPDVYPYAHLLAELVDALSVDVHLGESVHTHFASALRGLNRHSDPELVALLYAWRLLALAGLAPRTAACGSCGRVSALTHLDVAGGALTCADCALGLPLGEAVAAEIARMLTGRAADVLASPPRERGGHWRALERYLSYHVGDLASLEGPLQASVAGSREPPGEVRPEPGPVG